MPREGTETLYGRNPVYEALRAGRRKIYKLLVAETVEARGNLRIALDQARREGVPVERAPRSVLDRAAANHQGVLAVVSPYPLESLEGILIRARTAGEPALFLVLDTLQDPQNLGTLLRTAEAVGVQGVVIPLRHGAGVTPAVVSASSGAVEHLRIAEANLAQAIRQLKQAGLWVLGLENRPGAQSLESVDLTGPLALVVGGEAEGMRRLVREACDFRVRLAMRGKLESLNAAVAGSIALYAAAQARGARGGGPD